jgi:transcriptional regulator with XRE-family HTH domain
MVGQAIRAARTEQNLTQRELANRLHVHPTYLTNVEAGRVNLTIGSLASVAEALQAGLEIKFPTLSPEPIRIAKSSRQK